MTQPGFNLTLVSLDKEPQKARDWFASNVKDQTSFERNLLVDSEFKVADQLAVDAFPMTFVVGKDGRVRHVQRGYKPELKQTDELLKIAEALIAE
jgi:peroxiredoxin